MLSVGFGTLRLRSCLNPASPGAVFPECFRQPTTERTQEGQTDRFTTAARTMSIISRFFPKLFFFWLTFVWLGRDGQREAWPQTRTKLLNLQSLQHVRASHLRRVQVWSRGTPAEVAPSRSVCNRRMLQRIGSSLLDIADYFVS